MRSLNCYCWRKVADLIPATVCLQQRFWRALSPPKHQGSPFRKGPINRPKTHPLCFRSPPSLAWTQSRYQDFFPGPTLRASAQKPFQCQLHLDRDVLGSPRLPTAVATVHGVASIQHPCKPFQKGRQRTQMGAPMMTGHPKTTWSEMLSVLSFVLCLKWVSSPFLICIMKTQGVILAK